MFTILRGGTVYAPQNLGRKDVLLAGTVVARIADTIEAAPEYGETDVIDVSGCYVVPGFIDQHVHLTGGGGEGGFTTRTPEIMLSRIVSAGITTVVGCLGTDGVTRHMSSLLAKARALEEEGITAFIYTGAYEVPPPTLTGSVRRDIMLIDKIIGCGEVAISDHRSSQPGKEDIKKLAAETRTGGMLSGKAGVLHLHVGSGAAKLDMLFEILAESEIPITQFTPTHLNRNHDLLEAAARFGRQGGMIDFTATKEPSSPANGLTAAESVIYCLENGVSPDRITMSSDGNGSLPVFDAGGHYAGIGVADVDALHFELCRLCGPHGLPLETALLPITANPARSLKLYPRKGCLDAGSDADITVLRQDLSISRVFAKGRQMAAEGQVLVKGTFE